VNTSIRYNERTGARRSDASDAVIPCDVRQHRRDDADVRYPADRRWRRHERPPRSDFENAERREKCDADRADQRKQIEAP
jgi:hypothetical protein